MLESDINTFYCNEILQDQILELCFGYLLGIFLFFLNTSLLNGILLRV